MLARLAEPIRGVAEIALQAMHDAVPQIAVLGFAGVGQFVRFLEAGEIQPQARHGRFWLFLPREQGGGITGLE